MSSQDQKDFGSITSVELKDGPVQERGCTDILCCLIFTAFLIITSSLTIYSFVNGNPKMLIQPFDADHNGCGFDQKVLDYPYIYFAAPLNNQARLYTTVCVKQCPTGNEHSIDCYPNSLVPSCQMTKMPTDDYIQITSDQTVIKLPKYKESKSFFQKYNMKQQVEKKIEYYQSKFPNGEIRLDQSSGNYIYPTIQLGTACVPNIKQLLQDISSGVQLQDAQSIVTMFQQSWQIQIYCLLIALVISFIFINILKWFTGFFTWSLIIIAWLVITGSGLIIILWTNPSLFGDTISGMASSAVVNNSDISGIQNYVQNNVTDFQVIAGFLFTLSALYLVFIFCSCNNIKTAIGVTKASTIFMDQVLSSLFIPIIELTSLIAYLLVWSLAFVYLLSIGTINQSPHLPPYGQFVYSETAQVLLAVQIFAAFWIVCFFAACTSFVLGSAVCIWYYQQGDHPVWVSYWRVFRYHIGSVAFGSLIIAILYVVQVILAYIKKQYQDKTQGGNSVMNCIFDCLQCLINCFTRFMEFINKNAYVIIAFKDENFCSAAQESFSLAIRNAGLFLTLNSFGDLYIILGQITIGGSTAGCGYLIMTYGGYSIESQYYAIIAFAIIGLLIGTTFMSLFSNVSNALVVVYIMDNEIQQNHCGNKVSPNTPPEVKAIFDEIQA